MTDLEMTKLCADAMGMIVRDHGVWIEAPAVIPGAGSYRYNPLRDDAQAMALDALLIDERHSISFHLAWFCRHEYPSGVHTFEYHADMTKAENRRRARVECVAKMQQAKQ